MLSQGIGSLIVTKSLSPVALVIIISLFSLPLSDSNLQDHEKKRLVISHNQYRAEEYASNMMRLSWSNELENISKAYVAKCAYEPNLNIKEEIGENLYATYNQFRAKPAVDYWHVAGDNFNVKHLKCSSGNDCSRYLQVVCAVTEKIGCASFLCDKIKGTGLVQSTLLVCYYSPGGKKKCEKPFKRGIRCSRCPMSHGCLNKLCGTSNVSRPAWFLISILLTVAVWHSL